MSLFVASLNSGSNGNCYYVGNETEAVLIDGGISCRETEKRLLRLNIPIKKIKAIFVSHEHGDHIHGVAGLSKKYKLPVYITSATLKESNISLDETLVIPFDAYQEVCLGELTITAFPKHHDAADPHSFVISNEKVRVGVFTDIGRVCSHVLDNFKLCNAVFLESNYDEEMLENGSYPIHLKNRIRDGRGHLSNTQAWQLFTEHASPFLSHLFLSHLSRNNNTPKLALDLFNSIESNSTIILAPRDRETELYKIEDLKDEATFIRKQKIVSFAKQLSLFS